jgi:hypothetical protein
MFVTNIVVILQTFARADLTSCNCAVVEKSGTVARNKVFDQLRMSGLVVGSRTTRMRSKLGDRYYFLYRKRGPNAEFCMLCPYIL